MKIRIGGCVGALGCLLLLITGACSSDTTNDDTSADSSDDLQRRGSSTSSSSGSSSGTTGIVDAGVKVDAGGSTSGNNAGATLIYTNDFDKPADLSPNQLGDGSISSSVFKSGSGSYRSLVKAGASPISAGYRSEQQYDSFTPDEGIYEYDELFESLPGLGGLSAQWHGNTQGTSGQMSMWFGDGEFMIQRNILGPSGSPNIYQSAAAGGGPLMKVATNKWYHMRWEIKYSAANDGYVRMYIDNVLYYTVDGKTADGSGQFFKIGQNLFASPKVNSVLYIDNLRIYKK